MRIAQVPGPSALIPSGSSEETRLLAAAFCAHYSDAPKDCEVVADCIREGALSSTPVRPARRQRRDVSSSETFAQLENQLPEARMEMIKMVHPVDAYFINRNEISGDGKAFKWLSIKYFLDFSAH